MGVGLEALDIADADSYDEDALEASLTKRVSAQMAQSHAVAQQRLGEDPLSGALFVFSNRRLNRLKFLYWGLKDDMRNT